MTSLPRAVLKEVAYLRMLGVPEEALARLASAVREAMEPEGLGGPALDAQTEAVHGISSLRLAMGCEQVGKRNDDARRRAARNFERAAAILRPSKEQLQQRKEHHG